MVLPVHQTPLGVLFGFPQSPRRSRASKGSFLNPLVVPEVAQLSHPYTFITRGRASPRGGSGTARQSRAQSPRAPSAPRAGSACVSCAFCASAAPDSRATWAATIRASSAPGSHAAGAGPRMAPRCGSGAGWYGGRGGLGWIRSAALA